MVPRGGEEGREEGTLACVEVNARTLLRTNPFLSFFLSRSHSISFRRSVFSLTCGL